MDTTMIPDNISADSKFTNIGNGGFGFGFAERFTGLADVFRDRLGCVEHGVQDLKAGQRELAREVCEVKVAVASGLEGVKCAIKDAAHAAEVRDMQDKIAELREDRLLDRLACRGRGRRRSDEGNGGGNGHD